MYVCLCHGVTERAIRQAVQTGTSSFEQLQASTGVATCCGACRDYAETTWQDALAGQASVFQAAAARLGVSVL